MWPCTGRFNLLFWSLDCKKLLIQDISDWQGAKTEYEIEVQVPNAASWVKLKIDPSKINVFSNQDLGYGDTPLLDGIYCIRVKHCDNVIQIHRALVCRLKCCFRSLIASGKEVSLQTKELLQTWIEDIPVMTEAG